MGFLPPFLLKLLSSLGSQIADLTIRQNLSPVPQRHTVIRLARLPKDYQEKGTILAIQLTDLVGEFTLSTDDRKEIPHHLSVWVEALTTPYQAYTFLLAKAPKSSRKVALRLTVAQICNIVGSSGDGRQHLNLLQVLWVHRFVDEEKKIRDRSFGSDGHAGICGLGEEDAPEGLTKRQAKDLRKDLRAQLADLARQSPHEFLCD